MPAAASAQAELSIVDAAANLVKLDQKKASTTKGTKDHEGANWRVPFVWLRVLRGYGLHTGQYHRSSGLFTMSSSAAHIIAI